MSFSDDKVCSLCGGRAWMYTSKRMHPESLQVGQYRCWHWMMRNKCDQ